MEPTRPDTASSDDARDIRIGALSERLSMPIKSLRRMADVGEIPSTRTRGGHRVFDVDAVRQALQGKLAEPTIVPTSAPSWSREFAIVGLAEDRVWLQAATDLSFDRLTDGGRIASYAFTEMLNNAIDHSSGTSVEVELWVTEEDVAFRITDDGEGVFARVQRGLHLDNLLDAPGELTKGKRTTWSERHSGEGIFFTSKAVSVFRISSNGYRMTVDNPRSDVALGVSSVTTGSVVEATMPLKPRKTLREVFAEFTDDDSGFTRSRPTVKLFGLGLSFVSRSEARRVMENMSEFTDVDIDFAGVDDVGQGFIDEVLRVWPSQHPGIAVHPINMNEAVAFMARRTRPIT